MLSKILEKRFNERAKLETKALLTKLNISYFDEKSLSHFFKEVELLVNSLVMDETEGKEIDNELLSIYNTIIDIILDNEENIDFLNKIFIK